MSLGKPLQFVISIEPMATGRIGTKINYTSGRAISTVALAGYSYKFCFGVSRTDSPWRRGITQQGR